MLTKTDFVHGMQRGKTLWLDRHKPSLKIIPDGKAMSARTAGRMGKGTPPMCGAAFSGRNQRCAGDIPGQRGPAHDMRFKVFLPVLLVLRAGMLIVGAYLLMR